MRYVPIVLCALLVVACHQNRQQQAAKKEAPPEYYKLDASSAGKLRGVIRFVGKKPAARPISMNAEEACEKLHPTPVSGATVVVGKSGGLANTLVYIKSGLDGKAFEPPQEVVVLDQRGCMFVPRVLALRAGQTMTVKNSDPVSHNIHPRPENNREWNQQQSPGSPDLIRRFVRPEVVIPVRCNVHSWMRSYIAVMEHPYFAVTSEDGTFEWPAVPAGEYTIAAWHETLGEQTQKVTLGSRGEQAVEFTFR